MTGRIRLHGPSIAGRLRADAGLLLLVGLVVALTAVLTSALSPLTERTSDRAIAGVVRDAGLRGTVVATLPDEYDEPGRQVRDPRLVGELRQDAADARRQMPAGLAAVVRPGVTTVTTPALQLLDAGPGRYLRLAYVDTPQGGPAVTYVAGGPPMAGVSEERADVELPPDAEPWPVQVALSQTAAAALDVAPGDDLPAEDVQHRPVVIRVSGVYAAASPDEDAWQVVPELLRPTQGQSGGVGRISAAALVSAGALPDLRLAVPADDLTSRVVFTPRPAQLRWQRSTALIRAVVSLKAAPTSARGGVSWDSLLDLVLDDGRTQVAAARAQAEVLVVGLLACTLLLLLLAAQLLARRRATSVALTRERGASLLGIGAELLVEAGAVALGGSAIGFLVTWLLVGDVGWGSSLPVLVVASVAGPVLGAVSAARSTDARRSPANRSARRTALRNRRLQRLLLEAGVVGVAVLAFVALRQRGVGADGVSGDLLVASAPICFVVAAALLVPRVFAAVARTGLSRARGATGGVPLFVTARIVRTSARALPLLVVTVTAAQLTFGVALATTERHGQSAGALLAVGADARLATAPGRSADTVASVVADAPGVRAAVAGRVADGVRASSLRTQAPVTLVIVDASAYARLLTESALPDAPQLVRLGAAGDGDSDGRLPALLLGGEKELRDGLHVRWQDDSEIPLAVVGVAPDVGASPDPVIVVDARAFARSGTEADPNTVWAVGPGAAAAVRAAAGANDTVDLVDDVLAARRDAPLAAGLVHLAVASSLLLLLLAVLGVALAAATEAPPRAESLARLRSLGLGDPALRRVVAGELLAPVVVGSMAGLLLGIGCSFMMLGHLSLERVTGQTAAPVIVVPWWAAMSVVALLVTALVIAQLESTSLRRTALSELLRGGDRA